MKKYLGFLLIGVLFLFGCAVGPRMSYESRGRNVWEVCQQYSADCRWDGMLEMIVVEYQSLKVQGMVGNSYLIVNGISRPLSTPLMLQGGVVIVPVEFERMIVGVEKKETSKMTMTDSVVFVIDAGHGGKDPGAVGFGGIQEKDITLDIAKRVASGFEKAGVKILMTRTTDTFLTLQERTAFASRPHVGLFISIHANAHKNRSARGVEIYYSSPLNQQDVKDLQRMSNLRKICDQMNMQKNLPSLKDLVEDMLYFSKFTYSSILSNKLSQAFDGTEMMAQTRGSKQARFFVLRNTLVPAILVEVGFLTNPREARQLKESSYRQKIADIIVKKTLEAWYASGL